MAITLLKSFLKTDQTMSRYYVQGKQIQLGRVDFKAQGGEGSIYVKGSTAYKIYSDPQRAIAPAKLQELSVLTEGNIGAHLFSSIRYASRTDDPPIHKVSPCR